MERWKQYKTRNCDIEISNYGNIRGKKWNNSCFTEDTIKIINGRKCINRGRNCVYTYVWTLFNGPIPEGYVIHHKDHNKLNDRLDNLELMLKGEHIRHHHCGKKWNIFTYEKQKSSQTGKKRSNKTKLNMSKSRIGRHWFTNGVISKFCYECPDGYVKGRVILKNNKKDE